jgi:tetratricopeptide (TPR) repeat protein
MVLWACLRSASLRTARTSLRSQLARNLAYAETTKTPSYEGVFVCPSFCYTRDMSNKQIFLASSVVVILIVIIVGFIVLPKHATTPDTSSIAPTTIATSTSPYTVTTITSTSTLASTTPAFDINYWLQLGLTRKEIGDYAGAIQAWGQVTANEPTNYIAFYDLGDLYQNFDVNYPLAEQNYLKVIALEPNYIDAYNSLFTLYRYQYRIGTSAAANIVSEGLKNNPNNADLLALQAQLEATSTSQ